MGVVKLLLFVEAALVAAVLVWSPSWAMGQSANLGPNVQYPSPPANPVVQSIHPR